ncbi:hypothetical protein [uncultured Microscilla sp.]|uniref:hypothetical protein n=1 Tax=uncultured Microscilla sp. TaxID=432653 RepID=UPI002625BB29|nr:hypothetical protein [uncultured Microscilla sp.]
MPETIDNLPHESSSANHWIAWHKALKKRYGNKSANLLFSQAWEERGEDYANTTQLRNYAKTQGMEIEGDSIFSGVSDNVKNTWSSLNNGFAGIGASAALAILVVLGLIGFVTYKAIKD